MRQLRRRLQSAHCQPCGKWSYRGRQDAKNAAKALHPGEQGLRAYECPEGTGRWHFGHNNRHHGPQATSHGFSHTDVRDARNHAGEPR